MPSQKNPKRHRRALPQVITPATLRCIPVHVPDDPEWLAQFMGAIDGLGKRSAWDYDPATVDDLKAVSDLWRVVTDDVQQTILDGTNCEATTPTDPQDCTIINPVHPSIGWYPNHPVLTPDGTGVHWQNPAWCVDCGIPGVSLDTDVLLRLDALLNFLDIFGLFAAGVPSFTLHFSGEGQIDVRFASAFLGGWVYVFPDGNPLLGVGVDLEWHDFGDLAGTGLIELFIGLLQGDLVQQTVVTHEVNFTTPGSHTLTGWFFPKLDIDWPPLGWGGGLRDIQLCGDSILLEDAPMPYTLECGDSTLELKLDGSPVSTIDLDVCHPHPAPPAIPDYTLNRNNGDLQLLKDEVLHDSVQFPNYTVSYFESTHLLRLWRDSVIIDTAPLPSYTLTKPEDDEIHLHRNALTESIIEDKFFTYRLQENGAEHELTEDAAVVSSVTDDVGEGPDLGRIFELHYDWTVADSIQGQWVEISGQGDFVQDAGWVSEPLGSFQRLGTYFNLHSHFNFFRLKLEFLMTDGAEGILEVKGGPYSIPFTFSNPVEIGPGPLLHVEEFNVEHIVIGGDGDQRIALEYNGLDNDPDHIITMTRVWIQGHSPIEAYSAHTAHGFDSADAPLAGWIFPE